MRRKRYDQRQAKNTSITFHMLSFMSLATIGVAQMTSHSYALYTSQAQNGGSFTAAFVFPKTVEEAANHATGAAAEAARQMKVAQQAAQSCNGEGEDGQGEETRIAALVSQAQQASTAALSAAQSASRSVGILAGYLNQAQQERSARIIGYVQPALTRAQSAAASASQAATTAEAAYKQTQVCQVAWKAEEAKKAEEVNPQPKQESRDDHATSNNQKVGK